MQALIIETGKHKGKRLKLPNGESIIGRDEQAQVRIASNDVSRKHALLSVANARIVVRDLGSSNGTFVNGEPIQGDRELQPGDLLVIGPMGFRVPERSPSETAAADPAATLKKGPKDKLSDDDIALWLADGSSEPVSDGDTAVIAMQSPGGMPDPAPVIAPKKKTFRSVAEEAADIIRRHREAQSHQ